MLFIFVLGGWWGPSAVLARDSCAVWLRISWLLSCVNASSRKYSPVPTTGGGRVSRQAITRGPANLPAAACPALSPCSSVASIDRLDKGTDHRLANLARNYYLPLAGRRERMSAHPSYPVFEKSARLRHS